MEAGTDSQPMPSRASQSWYDEFGLIPRFPRPPLKEIGRLVDGIREPQIFLRGGNLRGGKRNTDVIIRLPVCSRIFPFEIGKAYAKFGVTLPKAFEDILWQKLEAEGSTTWAELAGLVIKAYRQTWTHWAELQYLGHFHPAAELMFKKIKNEVDSVSKTTHRGRQPSTQAELASLRKRYTQLLPKCAVIHRAAIRASAAPHTKNNEALARKEIRRAVWEQVRRAVHGMPGDGYIFGGEAFKRIPYGKPKLHDPTTWKPHQLAISLLTFERGQAYQTIEKKIVPTKYKR